MNNGKKQKHKQYKIQEHEKYKNTRKTHEHDKIQKQQKIQ